MATADTVLRDIETRSKWEYLPIIGADKARFLEDLVRAKKPCQTVEVGLLIGYATVVIARGLIDGCSLTGLEISGELAARAESNVAAAGLAAKVRVIQGDARQSLDQVAGPVDLVFLDAQKTQYLSYLKKLEPKLSPGAVIVANGAGIYRRELGTYLDYVRRSADYQSTSRVFGEDAMEISIYKKQ